MMLSLESTLNASCYPTSDFIPCTSTATPPDYGACHPTVQTLVVERPCVFVCLLPLLLARPMYFSQERPISTYHMIDICAYVNIHVRICYIV